jgi:hypothetical protein
VNRRTAALLLVLLGLTVVYAVAILGPFREDPASIPAAPVAGPSEAELLAADVRILFVGNSHTSYQNLPAIVCSMVRHAKPGTTVAHQMVFVSHLEDAGSNPMIRAEVERRPWTHVILQAQKVSMSGRYTYPTLDGIELAKAAKAKGAATYYFAEWGRKGVADERERTETIYQEMALAAGVTVIPVGRVWDAALAEDPEWALHDADGNHESPTGAYLTALVLASTIAGEPAAACAGVDAADLPAVERLTLAEIADRTLRPKP